MEIVSEIWRRATQRQPVPEPAEVLISALVALGLVVIAWPLVRMLTTVVHEAGHAVVATLAGRSLEGIRLHTDTSGLTVSRGRPTGPGMVLTFAAGYPAPAIFGLGAAWLLGQGYAVGLLWASLVLLALLLLKIRNFYGLLVLLALGGAIAAASWYLAPARQSMIAFTATWLLLLSAPRAALELLVHPSRTSDAGQLARLTRLPATFWVLIFLGICLACLVGGLALLLPQVLAAAGL
ncbi:M50 family metallopeptidase [Naumannella cuiyingiana]|uniref:Peptidase M50B-like protein n=1 Tax=Naumannella cuiyingiana TaxID=1347891 RepID=A0A7Z0IM58_9ACTN|nr:M50 family metallopeptidase [Naumannella cuiyingiana]NYI72232.1 hypothetical protein [Naumannella cuiyingiana]